MASCFKKSCDVNVFSIYHILKPLPKIHEMCKINFKLVLSRLFTLFFSICFIGCAIFPGPTTKKELIEDITSYETYINEVHANPFRLITKESFHDKVESTTNEILKKDADTISSLDCYFYLQEISSSIQDGHTRIYIPFNLFSNKDNVFPLKLKRINDLIYVIDNNSSETVPIYSSILEINQIPIETLFTECSLLFNTTLDHAKWLLFEDYFHLLLPMYLKVRPPWKVKYKLDSKVRVAELKAVTLKEFNKTETRHDNKYRKYSIFIQNEEVPVLNLPGFSYGEAESYEYFIDSFFKKYAEFPYLVIDIRENRGGSGYWGFYLIDNLTDSPYQIAEMFEFKVSERMRNSIYAGKAGNQLNNAKNGEYLEAVNHRMRVPHKTPKKFKGKVFLLISENTFSAGVVFAAVFKANRFGLIIGRETAGRISFGSDPVTVRLPNSKLKGSIPLAIYTLPGENPDRGVIPDIVVSRAIDEYRLGRDVEMEKIKSLIKEDIINRNGSD